MNRRHFLALLSMATAGAGMDLDLERLLWVPKPTIVVPTMPWTPHTIVTPGWMVREGLRIAGRRGVFVDFPVQEYDPEFVQSREAQ